MVFSLFRGLERQLQMDSLESSHEQSEADKMIHKQELETEKYVQVEFEKWATEVRKQTNKKAISDFVTFLVGLALIALGVFLVRTFEYWPAFFEQVGMWFGMNPFQ